VYAAFVNLDNKLYKMHSTYIKIINYYFTQTQGIQFDTWFLIALASQRYTPTNITGNAIIPYSPPFKKFLENIRKRSEYINARADVE
jgi:hypothetical protein